MIGVDVDISGPLQGFDRVRGRARDLRRFWPQVKPEIRADIKAHFSDKDGPAGEWQSWADSTKKKFLGERTASGRRRNVKKSGAFTKAGKRRWSDILGRLKSAWQFIADATSLEARSIPSWSGIHQHGGTAGHGAQIPARTFMWASRDVVKLVSKRIGKYLREAF